MGRVGSYLNILNKEDIVEAYFDYAPNGNDGLFEDFDIDADEVEIAKVKVERRAKILEFIERLADMEYKDLDCKETYILMAYPCFSKEHSEGATNHALICADKLSAVDIDLDYYPENEIYVSSHHPYETSSLAEIVGLRVADTPYTQIHLYELMAQVVYEALRFGFNQERLLEKYSDLEDPYGIWYKDWDYYFDDLEAVPDDSCDEPEGEPDMKKCSLYMDVYTAIIRYNSYCYAKESLALKESMQDEKFLRENLPWMMAEAEKKMKK
ncbi:MAG: hypothetical protein J6A73_02575 [Lachnospiraceae bacterium]|nr:hypothetical protein [Lachnospiraceae bacterium]